MIPFILAAVGGYLIGDSVKSDKMKFADGGQVGLIFKKGDKVLLKDGGGQKLATVVADGFDSRNRVRVRPDGFPMDISVPMGEKYSDDKRVYVIKKMADGGVTSSEQMIDFFQYDENKIVKRPFGEYVIFDKVAVLYSRNELLHPEEGEYELYFEKDNAYCELVITINIINYNDMEWEVKKVQNSIDELFLTKEQGNVVFENEQLRNEMEEAIASRYANWNALMADGGAVKKSSEWITAKEVEEDKGFYSDMYKDDNGFRPRNLSDEQLADWLNSNYKVVNRYWDGKLSKMIVPIDDNENTQYIHKKFAEGGAVKKGTRFLSHWRDTKGGSGYDYLRIVETNKTSGQDQKTKVMVLEVTDSSDKSRVGEKHEETSKTIHTLLKNNLYERVSDTKMADGGVMEDDYWLNDTVFVEEKSGRLRVTKFFGKYRDYSIVKGGIDITKYKSKEQAIKESVKEINNRVKELKDMGLWNPIHGMTDYL
jgi:hypothetical protein